MPVLPIRRSDRRAVSSMLAADPSFQKALDDRIRAKNGAQSSLLTGTLDSCGWQVCACRVAASCMHACVPTVSVQIHVPLRAVDEPCRARLLRVDVQKDTPAEAPPALQFSRSTEPFFDDFSKGLCVPCVPRCCIPLVSSLLVYPVLLAVPGETACPSQLVVASSLPFPSCSVVV
jgi:hypothetical protein